MGHGKIPDFFLVPIKLFQLIRISIMEKPSLIHGFLLFPHGYLALIAGKITGRKVGVSLIAGPVETYILGGSPIRKYSYCTVLPEFNILTHFIFFLLNKFDVITVTGNFTKKFLIEKGIDPKKIYILPHIVDDRFRPLNLRKKYDVIFVGRLAPVKHVEILIEVIALVKKDLPTIRVAIVGDGEEYNRLKELVSSLDLTNHIDFVGFQKDTWKWYNISKLSILTSEREGFPYSVIESLKCEVPVIVSNCGDVNDIVKDNFNGRIISDYNDTKQYAESIVKLLNNPNQIEIYSKNCLQSFSSESIESVWQKIIADGNIQ